MRDFELTEERVHAPIAGQPGILVADVDLDSQPSTDFRNVAAGPGFRMVLPKDFLVGMKHLGVAGMRVDVQLLGPAVPAGERHHRSEQVRILESQPHGAEASHGHALKRSAVA